MRFEIPDEFECPISGEMMKDPVMTVDGHSYERIQIEEWFKKGNKISPITGLPLDSLTLIPNHTLRKAIQQFCSVLKDEKLIKLNNFVKTDIKTTVSPIIKNSSNDDNSFSSKKENKYSDDEDNEKESVKSFEFPGFEKFEKDFSLLYEKLLKLFPEFLIKNCDTEAVSVNNFLVYQLIWTFKYLVEMAVLGKNKKWLTEEIPLYKYQFGEITHNINLADPDSKLQLQACINNAMVAPETAFKEAGEEIAFRWLENIISLGGSAIREVSKIMRTEEAKSILMERSLEIFKNNMAAIINAENYEQWQREKTFCRSGAALIANENRLQYLVDIQKKLKKYPKNASLLELQSRLLDEQKQYEAKEQKMQSRLGKEKHQDWLKEKQNTLAKIQVRSELDNLIIAYIEAGKQLDLEESKINDRLLLQLDALQKTFSKTLVADSIKMDLEKYKILAAPLLKSIQNLKTLSEIQLEEPTSELKVEGDIKSIPIKNLSSPSVWLLSEKLSGSDYTNLKTIRTVRKEYNLLKEYIAQSNHPSKDDYLRKNQISYEKYISKSVEFLLQQTPEKQIYYLYEIDEKQKYTITEIKQKSKELSLIYHPDKFNYVTINENIFVRIIAIREELMTRLKWEKIGNEVNVNIETISRGIQTLKTWFNHLIPSDTDSVLQGLREFNYLKSTRPSITYKTSSTVTFNN